LLLAVAGCMTVQKVQPAAYIPLHSPAVVWVTETDNSFVPVAGPHIVGDSLEGTWEGLNEPITIPLNEIQSVQARTPSPKRTILLFTSVGAVTAAVAYTLFTAGSNGSGNTCGFDKNGQQNQFC
jgi:hypothetical protein